MKYYNKVCREDKKNLSAAYKYLKAGIKLHMNYSLELKTDVKFSTQLFILETKLIRFDMEIDISSLTACFYVTESSSISFNLKAPTHKSHLKTFYLFLYFIYLLLVVSLYSPPPSYDEFRWLHAALQPC